MEVRVLEVQEVLRLGAGEGPASVGRVQPWIGRTARRARRSIPAVDGPGPERAGSSRASRRLVMARVVGPAPTQDETARLGGPPEASGNRSRAGSTTRVTEVRD